MFIDLIVGGCSGVISRTLTAPLELYKIQRQNRFMPNSTIRDVIKKEGIRYLWKGNLTNCVRVFPQTAVNYFIFEFSKNNIFNSIENQSTKHFLSGILGGAFSMISTSSRSAHCATARAFGNFNTSAFIKFRCLTQFTALISFLVNVLWDD